MGADTMRQIPCDGTNIFYDRTSMEQLKAQLERLKAERHAYVMRAWRNRNHSPVGDWGRRVATHNARCATYYVNYLYSYLLIREQAP